LNVQFQQRRPLANDGAGGFEKEVGKVFTVRDLMSS
jgi:hypothetical protein